MPAEQSSDFKTFFLLAFTRELIENFSKNEIFSLEEIIHEKKHIKKKPVIKKIQKNIKPILKPSKKPKLSKKLIKENFVKSILDDSDVKKFSLASGIRKTFELKSPLLSKKESLKKPIFNLRLQTPKKQTLTKGPIKKVRISLDNLQENSSGSFTVPVDKILPSAPAPHQIKGISISPKPALIDLGKLNPLIQNPSIKEIICQGENKNLILRGTLGTRRSSIKLDKKEIDDIINKFSNLTKIPVMQGIYKVVYGNLFLTAVVSDVVSTTFEIKKIPLASKMPIQRRM